jgi:hypothetical protein
VASLISRSSKPVSARNPCCHEPCASFRSDRQRLVGWLSYSDDRRSRKAAQRQHLEAAGLLSDAPKLSELQGVLEILTRLEPTKLVSLEAIELLEDLCPDDDTFDAFQDAYNLCELKRAMLTDKKALRAVWGLEAMAVLPDLLAGDEELGITPCPEAMVILDDVQKGTPAALAALTNLSQPEWRRVMAMMTQRQRRILTVIVCVILLPVLIIYVLGSAVAGELEGYAAGAIDSTDDRDDGCLLSNGSWQDSNCSGTASWDSAADADRRASSIDNGGYTNPSFYVLGVLPVTMALFLTCFGNRVASLVTMISVFAASSAAVIFAVRIIVIFSMVVSHVSDVQLSDMGVPVHVM